LTLQGFRVIYTLPKTKGVLIYMVIAGTINEKSNPPAMLGRME